MQIKTDEKKSGLLTFLTLSYLYRLAFFRTTVWLLLTMATLLLCSHCRSVCGKEGADALRGAKQLVTAPFGKGGGGERRRRGKKRR